MKKTLLTAMALGALFANNLMAQTWNVPTNASAVGTTTYLGTTGTGTSPLKIASNSSDIQFFTGAIGTAANEKMRIASNGNVGIGTPSPQYSLDVVGSSQRLGNCSFYGDPGANILSFNASPDYYGGTDWGNATKYAGYFGKIGFASSNGDFGITSSNTNATAGQFVPNSAMKQILKIDKSGNLFSTGNLQTSTANTGLVFWGGGEKIVGTSDKSIQFQTNNGQLRMTVKNDGQVVIGSGITVFPPNYKLLVEGGILTEKLKVAPKTFQNDWSWPDYVFSKSYKLNSLDSVENFINKNSHLPDVPSAKEIGSNGFDVAEMDAKLLRKVEELTLYVIEISKKEKENKEEVAVLKKKIEALEVENKELKK